MAQVVCVFCESYETDKVNSAVEKGFNLLGGVKSLFSTGEKVLLKPNLLAPELPEKAVTTHPSVFQAVALEIKKTGALLSFGDSPAIGSPKKTAKKTGILDVAEKLGINLADFENGEEVSFSEGKQNRKFTIAKGVLESDALVSIAKLKSHGLTTMTGAIKNQFGCIPGLLKGEFHVKLPDVNDFARMLVDLNLLLKPRLYVMDGIIAMEGNGPRGGTPRQMNIILISKDSVALDACVCRLMGINPQNNPMLRLGEDLGLGTFQQANIEILGDPLDKFAQNSFVLANKNPLSAFNNTWLRNYLVSRPEINHDKCINCGICIEMCPTKPKALSWQVKAKNKGTTPKYVKERPIYDYNQCIRCYCCQELCPEGVINLKTPFIASLFSLKKS